MCVRVCSGSGTNRVSFVTIYKNTWSTQYSPSGVLQAPSNKMDPKIYSKINWSTREFVFKLFFLQHVFLTFKVVFRMLIVDLSIPFTFYSGDCFDRVVILFNFRICVCECPVQVNWLWQTLVSADILLHPSLSNKSVFCVFACLHGYLYACMCIYFYLFFVF